MKRLALVLSAVCLVLVAIVGEVAFFSDPGGAESAGPVPSGPGPRASSEQVPVEPAALAADISVKVAGGRPDGDYWLDLDGGEATALPWPIRRTVNQLDNDRPLPAWASKYAATRDGSRLAYVGLGEEGTPQIFIARIDGSGARQVTHDRGGAMSPAWSPDASKVAYTASGTPFVMDVTTGESTALPAAGDMGPWPELQFTPDGSSLLYSRAHDETMELRTVPIDGGKSSVFIGWDEGFEVGNGSLSPDGSLVTMMGNEVDGPGAVRFVARPDGTKHRTIYGRSSNPAGTWSPDGTRIVCGGSDDKRNRSIVVVDVATGMLSPVAQGNGAIWLNQHTLLVDVP